ncbi:MAG: transcription antitermination factor NusB [Clostridiales bacterium]|nr:transcription antitermination factor NusB [Clostridiales bacterium]
MTIHEIRQAALKLVYEWDLGGEGGDETIFGLLALTDEGDIEQAKAMFDETIAHVDEIDRLVSANLHGWSLERISKVDLAILRLGTAEMLYAGLAPGIAISEALLLADEFSGDRSRAFINGVLGSISRGREA